jgi:hypothetical protein
VAVREMSTSLRCRIGLHRWHDATDPDDGTPTIVCGRCHKSISKPYEIMARIGWVGHQNS